MNITRKLSTGKIPTVHIREYVTWKTVEAIIDFKTGEKISVEVPIDWSNTAANILASKYLRKAGVPSRLWQKEDDSIPAWLRSHRKIESENEFGGETSAHQVFHRLAGHWTYTGWKHGYFKVPKTSMIESHAWQNSEEMAQAFYDEIYLMLAHQMAAPNSPQWFNTGLWWAYGIEGDDTGS